MSGYITANRNNILYGFLNIFKKFYHSVKDKFTKNDEMSLEGFINKYSDDKEFLNDLKFLNST